MLLVFVFVLITTLAQVNFNENVWLSSTSLSQKWRQFFIHEFIRFEWLQIHFLYFSVRWIMFVF